MSGILAAFLVFGVKIGLGLGAQLNHDSIPQFKKWGLLAGCLFIYLLLFSGMYFLVTGLNLLNYLDLFAQGLKYGMAVHFAMALGLFTWGLRLLLSPQKTARSFPLKASLLLIIPCPICAGVILMNLTLALSLFSLPPIATAGLLFGVFSGIILLTSGVITLCRSRINSIDNFLGLSMVLVCQYFFLTIIIAPIYPEIKAAFAMAVSNNPGSIKGMPFVILTGTALVLASVGFFQNYFMKVKHK